MKILFFIDDLGSGGAQRQIVNLACLCKNAGHEVRVLKYGNDDFFLNKLIDASIHVDTIICRSNLERMLRIRSYIRKGWQDVLISFLETPNFLANFSSLGQSKWKTITSERNANYKSFEGMKGKIYKWFERYSDAIICNSLNAKRIWIKYYPEYSPKLSVIHNCVDISPSIFNIEYFIRKDNRTNLIIVASYQKSKNLDGVIEALRLLTKSEKDKLHIECYGQINVFSGGTQTYDDAMEKISKYGLDKIITLNGPRNDILTKVQRADALGLFSKYEGFPNVVCEAMSLSKPIIMSRVSDYDMLVDKTNGILCDSDNYQTIADAFRELINVSDEKLLTMGLSSKRKADRLFDPIVFLRNWLNIIKY